MIVTDLKFLVHEHWVPFIFAINIPKLIDTMKKCSGFFYIYITKHVLNAHPNSVKTLFEDSQNDVLTMFDDKSLNIL